ncbi:MAG: NUDIX domain-containing protein [Urechidicola sp.]|nr:NUDIX domain-containing protein [Urechidicola sp.]
MYTIFVDDIPIYLTDNLQNLTKDSFYYKDDITIESVLENAKSKKFSELFLFHVDLETLWKEFKWFFKIEKAAGGLVTNQNDEVLFIYRFDTWDLPKGKIENGERKKEAAIREVEEECGISGLKIEKKLQKTYHIFQRNDREVLKITHWYKMKTDFKGPLTPQLEEGITKVVFKNQEETKRTLENSYGNIRLLFSSN